GRLLAAEITGLYERQDHTADKHDGGRDQEEKGAPVQWEDLKLRGASRARAGDGSRTRVTSLEGWCSAIELHPRVRVDGSRSNMCPSKEMEARSARMPIIAGAQSRPGDWRSDQRSAASTRSVYVRWR